MRTVVEFALVPSSLSFIRKLASDSVTGVSSFVVSVTSRPSGRSLTGTTLTVVVARLLVFSPSVTCTVMMRGVSLGLSLLLMNVMLRMRSMYWARVPRPRAAG